MKKIEFIDMLAKKLEMSRKDTERAYDTIFASLITALKEDKVFKVAGVGTFSIVHRATRKGINLQTRKPITIPAKFVMKFKASKKLKDDIAATVK